MHPRVVMLVSNPCVTDTRVIRSAEALAARGCEVTVLARSGPGTPETEERCGVRYQRFRLPSERRKAERAAAMQAAPESTPRQDQKSPDAAKSRRWHPRRTARLTLRRCVTSIGLISTGLTHLFVKPALALKPQVVHAHDLYTLLAGAIIARRSGAALIYDSHELEVDRNGITSGWERFWRGRLERILIGRARAVITVSDSIADFLAERYAIPRPTVIHNSPRLASQCPTIRDLRTEAGVDARVPLALYIGALAMNRGLEQAIQSLLHLPEVHLSLVGPRNPRYKPDLDALIHTLGLEDRVHFHDPVPSDELLDFVKSADLSLVLIQDACLSYRFCFPNKLLESLFAGLPIVAASLPELRALTTLSGGGVTVNQEYPAEIAAGIRKVLENRNRLVANIQENAEALQIYSWENQEERLAALYGDILRREAISGQGGI